MQTFLPTLSFLLLAAAAAPAQNSRPTLPGENPEPAGVYRMSEAVLLAEDPDARPGPAILFENGLLSGRYALPLAGEEWVETGLLPPRSADGGEQINALEFTYCSTAPDPTGNAGSFTLRLYDSWVDGVGPAADARICSYEIRGLPLGGPAGEPRCWTVLVDLAGGFECSPDLDAKFRSEGGVGRRFGIGLVTDDPDTGFLLAEGGLGSEDHLDVLDAATGAFREQIWFDGSPHAGLAVRLLGNEPGVFRYYPQQPGPRDRLRLQATSVQPGQVAVWWVEPWRPDRFYWLYAALQPDDRPFQGMTFLLSPNVDFPRPMPGGQLTYFIPFDVPPVFYVQAVETTDGISPSPVEFRATSQGLQHVSR